MSATEFDEAETSEDTKEIPDDADDVEEETTVADATDVIEEEQSGPDDVEEATVNVSEDEVGGSDLWDGVEGDEDDDSDSENTSDETDSSGDLGAIADGLEGNSGKMEDAVNSGVGRLLVTGLTEDDFEDSNLDKSSLQTELTETAEAFRLGYFATEVVETYVLDPADGEVSPTWGLLGAALMMCGMAVWLRPDGDEAVAKARETIGNITSGGMA